MLYSFRLYYIQFKEVKILWGPRARGLGPIVECEGRITQRPLVNTQNSHCMQGILLQIRYFERELSNSFKKDNFIFLSNRMSSVCPSHVIHMSLVCTRMSSVSHSYVLVCHSYVTCMWFCHEPFILLIEDISGGFQTLKCILQRSCLQFISLKLIYFNKMLITYKRQ